MKNEFKQAIDVVHEEQEDDVRIHPFDAGIMLLIYVMLVCFGFLLGRVTA